MEVEPIPQQAQEKIEQVDSADLVVGVLADLDQDGLVIVCDALRTLSGSPRIAVLQDDHAASPAPANSEPVEKSASPYLDSLASISAGRVGYARCKHVHRISSRLCGREKLEARACCVIASRLETLTPRMGLPTGATAARRGR